MFDVLPSELQSRIVVVHCPVPDIGDCWLWTGFVNKKTGYGQVWWNKEAHRTHRLIFQLSRKTIPEGMTLDHLCRVRSCCNPDHLEAVTHRENILRGIGVAAIHAKQTHCVSGHEFTPENTYTRPNGLGRDCKTCRDLRIVRFKSRRPARGISNKDKTYCKYGHELSEANVYLFRGSRFCKLCAKRRNDAYLERKAVLASRHGDSAADPR